MSGLSNNDFLVVDIEVYVWGPTVGPSPGSGS